MANNLGLDPFPDPVGHFGLPWQPFWISRPLIGWKSGMLGSKNLFSESCSQHPITIEKWSPFFDLGGPRLVCLPPKTKSCSNQKTYLAKVVRSTHITIEKWFPFFIGGVQDLFAFPPKGGRQTKSCSGGKNYIAKVDRSTQVTIEKWPPFLIWGV